MKISTSLSILANYVLRQARKLEYFHVFGTEYPAGKAKLLLYKALILPYLRGGSFNLLLSNLAFLQIIRQKKVRTNTRTSPKGKYI